jgi:hypothetical protein
MDGWLIVILVKIHFTATTFKAAAWRLASAFQNHRPGLSPPKPSLRLGPAYGFRPSLHSTTGWAFDTVEVRFGLGPSHCSALNNVRRRDFVVSQVEFIISDDALVNVIDIIYVSKNLP